MSISVLGKLEKKNKGNPERGFLKIVFTTLSETITRGKYLVNFHFNQEDLIMENGKQGYIFLILTSLAMISVLVFAALGFAYFGLTLSFSLLDDANPLHVGILLFLCFSGFTTSILGVVFMIEVINKAYLTLRDRNFNYGN